MAVNLSSLSTVFNVAFCGVGLLILVWFLYGYIYYKIKVNRMMKKVEVLEEEKPIIGHLLLVSSKQLKNNIDMYRYLDELTNGLKDDKRFWVMNFHFFAAVRQSTIEKVLTSPDAVEKSYLYFFFEYFMNGAFSAPTDKWRKMRKKLNSTFNPKLFPHFTDQINLQAQIFVNKFTKKYKQGDTEFVNMLPFASKFFFDVVTSTHLGVITKQQHNKNLNVAEEISRCTELVFLRASQPWLHPDFVFQKSDIFQEIKKAMAPHQIFLTNLVKKSEECQKDIDATGNPLGWKSYGSLVKEILEEMGEKATPESVGQNLSDLLVAGSDTASVALSNLLYHLGLNPEFQEKAYKEIFEVLDEIPNNNVTSKTLSDLDLDMMGLNETKGPDGEEIEEEYHRYSQGADWQFTKVFPGGFGEWTRNRLDRLHFVETLIKESLRLCSPPVVLRYLTTDINVGDYTIPKGTNVGVCTKCVQRNPDYWEHPNSFHPDHFSPEKVRERPKFAFLPFSHGPRDCPGKAFAMYGMKCIVAEIIRNFKIVTKPPDEPVTFKLVFMIEQVEGYPVKLIPRH